jgi:hypothetical protein
MKKPEGRAFWFFHCSRNGYRTAPVPGEVPKPKAHPNPE